MSAFSPAQKVFLHICRNKPDRTVDCSIPEYIFYIKCLGVKYINRLFVYWEYMKAEYTTIKVKPENWRKINQERYPSETFDEVITRIIADREKLRDMLMNASSKKEFK